MDELEKSKFNINQKPTFVSIEFQLERYIFNNGIANSQTGTNCTISGSQIILGEKDANFYSKHPEWLFRPYITADKQYFKTIEVINIYKFPPIQGSTNYSRVPENQRVTYIWKRN
ncbi:hypothetical protein [Flavobacterium sp.]|uniref:hypothetical protein n=1 Tax=Flavobacterium sp. TaxID=239 RepID=UPI003750294B